MRHVEEITICELVRITSWQNLFKHLGEIEVAKVSLIVFNTPSTSKKISLMGDPDEIKF